MDRSLGDVYLIAVHYTVYAGIQVLLSHTHLTTLGYFACIAYAVTAVYGDKNDLISMSHFVVLLYFMRFHETCCSCCCCACGCFCNIS